jgi:hypothetical protein
MGCVKADADLARLERAERAWHRNLDALAHKVNSANEQIAELDATRPGSTLPSSGGATPVATHSR